MESRQEALPIRLLRFFFAFLLVGFCVAFIWHNSLQPPDVSAEFSRRVAAILGRFANKVFGAQSGVSHFLQQNVRKIAHAVEFALLGATSICMLAILGWMSTHMVLHGAFLVLLVAVADETIQAYTGRGSSVLDVALDFAGGLAGICLAGLIYLVIRGIARRIRS